MRILIGLGWLWAFQLAGGALADLVGLPLPGSVVGLGLLWAALETGLVRLAWLERGATTLLGLLGMLFVPAGAGVVAFLDAGTVWIGAAAIVVGGTLVTLAVTGLLVERTASRG